MDSKLYPKKLIYDICFQISDFPGGSDGKASAYKWETQVRSLGWEDPLEKEMATHCSTLVWKIPWMEEPGRLQSMGSQTDTTEQPHFHLFSRSFSSSSAVKNLPAMQET